MGMDFYNCLGVKYKINRRGWSRLRRLARMYGWAPRGTLPPEYWDVEEWWDPMDYSSNFHQTVTVPDAFALAAALELALADLKPKDPADMPELCPGEEYDGLMDVRMEFAMFIGLRDPGYLLSDDTCAPRLHEFIEFCRDGEFKIH